MHLDLTLLVAMAEQYDVVMIFADGLEKQSLLLCLDALERMRSGPTLIVVTDHVPAVWMPTLERDRLATVITRMAWTTNGLDLLQSYNSSAAVALEYSGPELPFTD